MYKYGSRTPFPRKPSSTFRTKMGTLQAAFGTWPSDLSFDLSSETRNADRFSVNEGFDFMDEPADQSSNRDVMMQDPPSRSPSPSTLGEGFDRELRSLWSDDSRKVFHDMVTADGYVNRYRMHMKKRQRLAHHLEHPDLDPVLCDGTKDHQTKYQAANWTLIDGKLFRKPEVGRVGKLRRHLDEVEAWEVLTREHLRSGHLGRDKIRKRLEQRYIGYTLQEIMLVLKECRRCGGCDKLPVNGIASQLPRQESTPTGRSFQRNAGDHSSYGRGQTSNMMWP